ncbi:hypothetical protein EBR96_01460 [bacterium]|nr:hypothetical protein [bacterium]
MQTKAVEFNIANEIIRFTRQTPQNDAIIFPLEWDDSKVFKETIISYGELGVRVGKVVNGLRLAGFKPGDRIVVLFAPSIDLYVLLIALFCSNIAAVFIDIGFPIRKVIECVRSSGAKAVIGVKELAFLKMVFPSLWKLPIYCVDKHLPLISRSYSEIRDCEYQDFGVTPCGPDDSCIVSFTGGSTGSPKAADRTHSLLLRQINACSQVFPHSLFQRGMSTFPVSAFWAFSTGKAYCIPAVNLKNQAGANPLTIGDQVRRFQINGISSGPAFMAAIVEGANKSDFESIRYLLLGGAPVSRKLARKLCAYFPNSRIDIAYGSTEVDPVSIISVSQFLESADPGIPVGRPVEGVLIKVVDISRIPPCLTPYSPPHVDIDSISVDPGIVGEVVVWAPHMMERYLNPESTARQKISDVNGVMWHRMGDAGYMTEAGELVLVGRIGDELAPGIYSFPLEQQLNEGAIRRAAVVKVADRVIIAIEPIDGKIDSALLSEAEMIAQQYGIHATARYVTHIPVDVRHNTRIMRAELRKILLTH